MLYTLLVCKTLKIKTFAAGVSAVNEYLKEVEGFRALFYWVSVPIAASSTLKELVSTHLQGF